MKLMIAASPTRTARIAGVFYLFTILTGIASLYFVSGTSQVVVGLLAGVSYMAVTLLFYYLFKPVNRDLSRIAALVSLVGFFIGIPNWQPGGVNVGIVCFGIYCLLIGYLIFRSTFLPRILGVLMAFAGLAYLTFLSPWLGSHLFPFHVATGVLGEGALTLWLLAFGVNADRWTRLAGPVDKSGALPEPGIA